MNTKYYILLKGSKATHWVMPYFNASIFIWNSKDLLIWVSDQKILLLLYYVL